MYDSAPFNARSHTRDPANKIDPHTTWRYATTLRHDTHYIAHSHTTAHTPLSVLRFRREPLCQNLLFSLMIMIICVTYKAHTEHTPVGIHIFSEIHYAPDLLIRKATHVTYNAHATCAHRRVRPEHTYILFIFLSPLYTWPPHPIYIYIYIYTYIHIYTYIWQFDVCLIDGTAHTHTHTHTHAHTHTHTTAHAPVGIRRVRRDPLCPRPLYQHYWFCSRHMRSSADSALPAYPTPALRPRAPTYIWQKTHSKSWVRAFITASPLRSVSVYRLAGTWEAHNVWGTWKLTMYEETQGRGSCIWRAKPIIYGEQSR